MTPEDGMDAKYNASLGSSGLAEPFGLEHFGACDFNDRRLTARAVKTADAMLRHPGGTPPSKLAKAELLGFYDFANNVKVSHDNVLAAHRQRTLERMGNATGVVLVIHDTTEADFSGLDIDDLGPIGNGLCRGLLLHNVLAYDLEKGEVIGLVGQLVHRRRKVPKGEGLKRKREHPQRESLLWIKGSEAVGQVPPGRIWVNLNDRGGDTFENLEKQQSLGQFYCVRSKSNRLVEVKDSTGRVIKRKLHHWARDLPTLAQQAVSVSANRDQPAREAKVRIAAGAVGVLPPRQKRGAHGRRPLELWIVYVKELQAPAGVEPLEWFILTNVPTETKAQCAQRVGWYEKRPVIEEYHKAQKTGCGMELMQFTTRHALEVSIAMLSVVAVQLLRLRDLSRRPEAQTTPATEEVDAEYVEVLSLWRYREHRPQMTVWEFLRALAKLGGHLNRAGDRPAGWLVLWRGWTNLQLLVDGARTVRRKRCG
jgi:hypothetical protein